MEINQSQDFNFKQLIRLAICLPLVTTAVVIQDIALIIH